MLRRKPELISYCKFDGGEINHPISHNTKVKKKFDNKHPNNLSSQPTPQKIAAPNENNKHKIVDNQKVLSQLLSFSVYCLIPRRMFASTLSENRIGI